jgi:diguanylate cyclase (GGDEF)-like protein
VLHQLRVIAGLRDDDRLTREEQRRLVLGRSGALVFSLSSVFILVAGAIGGRSTLAVVWIPAIGLLCALLVLAGYRYLGRVRAQCATAMGTALIGEVVYLTRPSYGVLYVIVACCLAFFSPPRWMIAQTCWILICYWVAVRFGHNPQGHPLEPWVLLAGTLAATTSLITTLQKHAARLARSERKGKAILDAFFANSPLGIVLLDRDLTFVRVNDTYASWSKRTPEDHVGRRLDEINPGSETHIGPALRTILDTGQPLLGREATHGGRILRASHYPIRGADGKPFLIASILDDVTDIKHAEARLEELLTNEQAARFELERARWKLTARNHQLAVQATTDPLTKLLNRTAFEERLSSALQSARSTGKNLGVLYIDLDGFKGVNDRHGHAAGDELLEILARRLTASRRTNDLIARMGGDEFLILLADLDPDGARETLAAAAERIQEAIAAPARLAEAEISISSSVGTSLFPADGDSATALVAAADSAMYRRKRAA